MERIPNGKYTKEFREEAVKLVTEEKLSIPETARRLNLPKSTLKNWMRKYRAGKLGEVGINYRPLTEVEIENARLKKALAVAKMECEILKKAAAYVRHEGMR
jgi:transposase-like protein